MNEQTEIFPLHDGKFDKDALRAEYKGKLKKHDMFTDNSISSCFIWPELDNLSRSMSEIVVDLQYTKQHSNAVCFFMPLIKRSNEGRTDVFLEVTQDDIGLQTIHGKYKFKCYKVRLEYSRWSHMKKSETVYFSLDPNHQCVVNEDFRQEAMSEGYGNVADYLNVCYERSMMPHKSMLLRMDENYGGLNTLFKERSALPVNRYIGDSIYEKVPSSISIESMRYYTNSADQMLIMLHGPLSELEWRGKLLETRFGISLKILAESKSEEEFVGCLAHEFKVKKALGSDMRRHHRHQTIVDICIALSHLNAPYSILDIVDMIPSVACGTRLEKVGLIESTFASIRRVWAKREEIKSAKR